MMVVLVHILVVLWDNPAGSGLYSGNGPMWLLERQQQTLEMLIHSSQRVFKHQSPAAIGGVVASNVNLNFNSHLRRQSVQQPAQDQRDMLGPVLIPLFCLWRCSVSCQAVVGGIGHCSFSMEPWRRQYAEI